jgi:hypothetical protein
LMMPCRPFEKSRGRPMLSMTFLATFDVD